MTKAQLEEERYKLMKEYWATWTDTERWDVYGDFKAGFSAAVAIMERERVKPLRDAIVEHVECEPGMYGNECVGLGGADGLKEALSQVGRMA